jgi:transcriptional regulator NrdR family protein
MLCLNCEYPNLRVVSSERDYARNIVKRRRECLRCGTRFTTNESFREQKPTANGTKPPIGVIK